MHTDLAAGGRLCLLVLLCRFCCTHDPACVWPRAQASGITTDTSTYELGELLADLKVRRWYIWFRARNGDRTVLDHSWQNHVTDPASSEVRNACINILLECKEGQKHCLLGHASSVCRCPRVLHLP